MYNVKIGGSSCCAAKGDGVGAVVVVVDDAVELLPLPLSPRQGVRRRVAQAEPEHVAPRPVTAAMVKVAFNPATALENASQVIP